MNIFKIDPPKRRVVCETGLNNDLIKGDARSPDIIDNLKGRNFRLLKFHNLRVSDSITLKISNLENTILI